MHLFLVSLLLFVMFQVFPVDDALLQRTKQWLLGRADGKGGFLRDSKSLDSFGRAPDEIVCVIAVQFCFRCPCLCLHSCWGLEFPYLLTSS